MSSAERPPPNVSTIGIDVTALSTPASGGIGTSQYETLKALARLDTGHRFIMYAAEKPVVPFSETPLDLPFELRLGSGPTTRSNILWMQTGVNRLLAEDGVDVFWSPRHLLPFRAPRRMATVATIQDFWYLHFPEQQPPVNRVVNRRLIERILGSADRIVTTSTATALDAIEHYDTDKHRIDVVPLAVDHNVFRPVAADELVRVRKSHDLTGPYVLAMDAYNPRKNFRLVLEAFAALPESLRESTTVVATGRPRKTAAGLDIGAIAAAHGIANRLRLLGDVPFGDLAPLYSGAAVFAYPSLYEGFGMPVLEAMACGCPVVTSACSSLPEVAGEAALTVDPGDTVGMTAALAQLLNAEGPAERLRSAGIDRAAGFTWERTARLMAESFERALSGRRR